MAIKDTKSPATQPSIKSIAAAAAAPSDSVPAALAATPDPVATKPVSAKKRTAVAAKPVPVAAAPVTAKPAPAVVAAAPPAAAPKPVVPEPAAPAPVVAEPAPIAIAPEPVAPAPASVLTPSQPQPVVAAAASIAQKEAKIMETVQSAAETTQARAQAMFADVNDRTKTAMEKGSKMIEEMNEFSKGNIEALVESSKIAAKGIETMGQEAAEYGRKQLESATAALKTLSSVKSPTDFLKLHSDYMRSAFDAMVAETSKNTESMLKLAGEITQPISNRVAVAAEKIKVAA
ncbi:phasin family protein [Sphingomonas glacialis]|uniref:Phasin family protein n=1 Tax=Sphingomonas glacialis TaxID=658225 RepID=A0A502FUP8_9SPHN|nr:phasin family protein [Sphingomonas glacialis]TPG52982.1 phasin family protein [Sphingomonas glacialis]